MDKEFAPDVELPVGGDLQVAADAIESNVVWTVGSFTFGLAIIAAIAAFSARETFRIHLNDLGIQGRRPVPQRGVRPASRRLGLTPQLPDISAAWSPIIGDPAELSAASFTEGAMTSVLVLNGPNLNLLGTRKPEVYGSTTLADVEEMCREEAGKLGLDVVFRQSNHEGQLIDWIHEFGAEVKAGNSIGAVYNPGAHTHTSVALHDAIEGASLP